MEATEVRLKKGEPVDRALRRLKKKLDKNMVEVITNDDLVKFILISD